MVGTNDLDKSEKFYNKLLDTVGLKKIYCDEICVPLPYVAGSPLAGIVI